MKNKLMDRLSKVFKKQPPLKKPAPMETTTGPHTEAGQPADAPLRGMLRGVIKRRFTPELVTQILQLLTESKALCFQNFIDTADGFRNYFYVMAFPDEMESTVLRIYVTLSESSSRTPVTEVAFSATGYSVTGEVEDFQLIWNVLRDKNRIPMPAFYARSLMLTQEHLDHFIAFINEGVLEEMTTKSDNLVMLRPRQTP